MFKFFKRANHYVVWIALILVGIRLLLPMIGHWAINQALDTKLEHYRGHIEDFDLSLYRGAYQLQGLEIRKRNSSLPPILKVKEIDLSLAWRALLRKEISADIQITGLSVNLLDSSHENEKQFGTEESKTNWESAGGVLIPVAVESLIIQNSSVYFANSDLKTQVPVSLEHIYLRAQDVRIADPNTPSPFHFKALLQGHAAVMAEGDLKVVSSPPELDLDFQVENFELAKLNKLLLLYVPLDITSGQLSLYGETLIQKGQRQGYLKVFFKDGDILAPKQNFLSGKHFFLEIIGAFSNWLLKNNESRKVAAYIPFSSTEKPDALKIIWSSIKNTWEQITPGIDHSISAKK